MPIDPSIALGIKTPTFMGPQDVLAVQNNMYRNQLTQLQMAEAQRGLQGRNAMAAGYQPGNIDAVTGTPNQNFINQLGQQFPEQAAELQQNFFTRQAQLEAIKRNQALAKKAEQEAINEQRDRDMGILSPIMQQSIIKYDDAVSKGITPQKAQQDAQKFYADQLEELEKSGQFPQNGNQPHPAIKFAKSQTFNPYAFRQYIAPYVKGAQDPPRTRPYNYQDSKTKEWMVGQEEYDPISQKWVRTGSAAPKFAKQVPAVVNIGGGARGRPPNMGNYNQFARIEEQMLKPIEDAQRQSQEIRGLIASAEPSASIQVQKLLTQYLNYGRMTNQQYGDNKSFGAAYNRAANAISRWATGDYSNANKQMILSMLKEMDSKVFNPARKNVIEINKKRLKEMGGREEFADRPATFGGGDADEGGIPTGWKVKVK